MRRAQQKSVPRSGPRNPWPAAQLTRAMHQTASVPSETPSWRLRLAPFIVAAVIALVGYLLYRTLSQVRVRRHCRRCSRGATPKSRHGDRLGRRELPLPDRVRLSCDALHRTSASVLAGGAEFFHQSLHRSQRRLCSPEQRCDPLPLLFARGTVRRGDRKNHSLLRPDRWPGFDRACRRRAHRAAGSRR